MTVAVHSRWCLGCRLSHSLPCPDCKPPANALLSRAHAGGQVWSHLHTVRSVSHAPQASGQWLCLAACTQQSAHEAPRATSPLLRVTVKDAADQTDFQSCAAHVKQGSARRNAMREARLLRCRAKRWWSRLQRICLCRLADNQQSKTKLLTLRSQASLQRAPRRTRLAAN